MGTHTRIRDGVNNLKNEGKRVVYGTSVSPIIESMMRLGYIARGLVYGVIGVLALEVALGIGGSLDDPQGAIVTMGKTPFGAIILYGILLGLIGYALWGFIRAIFDPLHKGTDSKGLVERLGYAISGISYGLLALATYALITGGRSAAQNGAQGQQTQQAAASILTQSWGPVAVGIVGVIVIVVGLVQIVRGIRRDFDLQFKPYALTSDQLHWFVQSGRFGMAARGVVFMLVGVFLDAAAFQRNASQAKGIDGVLATLLHQTFGPWLLGLVALGLIAFGIYSATCGLILRFKR